MDIDTTKKRFLTEVCLFNARDTLERQKKPYGVRDYLSTYRVKSTLRSYALLYPMVTMTPTTRENAEGAPWRRYVGILDLDAPFHRFFPTFTDGKHEDIRSSDDLHHALWSRGPDMGLGVCPAMDYILEKTYQISDILHREQIFHTVYFTTPRRSPLLCEDR